MTVIETHDTKSNLLTSPVPYLVNTCACLFVLEKQLIKKLNQQKKNY